MKQKNLYLMCGTPGAGKSTWLRKNCIEGRDCVISRDEIRFAIVPEGESYFSKEKEVYKNFIARIQDAIDEPDKYENIYCDATHITERSRDKLIESLDLTNIANIIVIVVRPSLEETLKRNKNRTGRALVPDTVVRKMYMQFERPENDTKHPKDVIYVEVPEIWNV